MTELTPGQLEQFKVAGRAGNLGKYHHWLNPERIVANVDALYREYRGGHSVPDMPRLFGLMAQVRTRL
jgi:hypothetical protein